LPKRNGAVGSCITCSSKRLVQFAAVDGVLQASAL
jgi:hypothetical protein